MNVMDNTMTGAASGETQAAPKDSKSQAKGQKINKTDTFVILFVNEIGSSNTNLFLFEIKINLITF